MIWYTSLSIVVVWAFLLCATSGADEQELPRVEGLTATVVNTVSSMDGTEQPCIVGVPDNYDPQTPTPLLVGLHTWSASYPQQLEAHGKEAVKRGWLLVLPHFRGPNLVTNPHAQEAGGSVLAQHDIVDCYRYMLENFNVDTQRVYMTGASGGGHMALLMASKYPDLWAAVAAWVPVTDLRTWHGQSQGYAPHVEAVCGGPPDASAQVNFEYLRRSPRTFITNLAHTHVLLGHGDQDLTIPVEQSWDTFRRLKDVPSHRLDFYVFSGGHTDRLAYGLDWCSKFTRPSEPPTELHLVTDESKSYYWADLGVADPGRLAPCTLKLRADVLSVGAENLTRLGLNLSSLSLPAEGGFFLTITNARELQLDLSGLPQGARLEGKAGWANAQPRTRAGSLRIAVEPGAEARTCRIAY